MDIYTLTIAGLTLLASGLMCACILDYCRRADARDAA